MVTGLYVEGSTRIIVLRGYSMNGDYTSIQRLIRRPKHRPKDATFLCPANLRICECFTAFLNNLLLSNTFTLKALSKRLNSCCSATLSFLTHLPSIYPHQQSPHFDHPSSSSAVRDRGLKSLLPTLAPKRAKAISSCIPTSVFCFHVRKTTTIVVVLSGQQLRSCKSVEITSTPSAATTRRDLRPCKQHQLIPSSSRRV